MNSVASIASMRSAYWFTLSVCASLEPGLIGNTVFNKAQRSVQLSVQWHGCPQSTER